MNKGVIFILIIILFILAASLGYFIFQNQRLVKKISSQSPSPIMSIQQSPDTDQIVSSPSPSPSPILTLQHVKENIEAGVNSKNFAPLTTYMTDPLFMILQATECCGPQTPTEAESQMSYITDGIPFDFNQDNATIKNLKAKNPELAGKFIGISQAKEHLIAFSINSDNKIEGIRMSVSWNLFIL